MNYPLVQFVSAPAETATVRFDFNEDAWADDSSWPEHDGFSLGAPTLEGDPDGVDVQYGFRSLTFSLIVKGSRPAALARQSALAREILRQTNWLRFQLDEYSPPVWFRTYRTAPGELSFEHLRRGRNTDIWGLGVTLTADPFALGERRTGTPVTVSNDPAAGANGCFFDVTGVVGDAPAAVSLAASSPLRASFLLAARQHGTPSDLIFFKQAESASALIADTTNPGGGPDAAMSGAGTNNYLRTTFATDATLQPRVAWTMSEFSTLAAKRALNGRFRVLAAVRRTDATSPITVRASVTGGETGATVTTVLSTARQLVDLGVLTLAAQLPTLDGSDASPVVPRTLNLAAARASGTGSLDWDVVFIIPADEMTLTRVGSNVTSTFLVDSENEMVYAHDAGDPFLGTAPLQFTSGTLAGAFPTVAPGETNRFYLLLGSVNDTFGAGHDKTLTQTITPHYWPRYLYLAGD